MCGNGLTNILVEMLGLFVKCRRVYMLVVGISRQAKLFYVPLLLAVQIMDPVIHGLVEIELMLS